MYSLDYNKLKYFLFIFLLIFIIKFSYSQEKNYLDTVIQRINDLETELKNMRNNAVNIEFLKDRTKKLTEDVEKLIRNGNGAHQW